MNYYSQIMQDIKQILEDATGTSWQVESTEIVNYDIRFSAQCWDFIRFTRCLDSERVLTMDRIAQQLAEQILQSYRTVCQYRPEVDHGSITRA